MSVWDWLSKKMDEDMPRDSFAEQVKKQQQEWAEESKKSELKYRHRVEEMLQDAEETSRRWKQQAEEEHRQWEKQVAPRIQELKQAFEASGRKYNSAEPNEVEELLTLTEKKIIQQCRRPKCHGCKLGWICPKFWSE